MKLTSQQQKVLQPMIVSGLTAYHHPMRNAMVAYWNDDLTLAVRVGKVMTSLVDAKLVEWIDNALGHGVIVYRPTPEAKQYRCDCLAGVRYDEFDNEVSPCPCCYRGCLSTPK